MTRAVIVDNGLSLKNGNKAVGILNPLELEKDFASRVLETLASFNIIMKERKELILGH